MLIKRITYGIIFAACLLFFSCKEKKSGVPGLEETYRKNDDRPFGGSVAYKLLEQLYPGKLPKVKKESIEKTWKDIYDTASVFVSVSRSLYTSDEDVEAALAFVKSGNDMLLCAASFDYNLTGRIGCSVNFIEDYQNVIMDVMDNTSVHFDRAAVQANGTYKYYYRPFSNYFNNLPKDNFRILGYNSKGLVNSFVYFYGKGRLFMHCDPRVFSNYFLLQKDNYQYMQNLMSLTKKDPQHLYWNDYYVNIKRPRSSSGSNSGKNGSSLSEIMKNPPLQIAFWLILSLLLLYILFGMKRKQRIIEKIKPNENTSVNFTETVGRLYLQKKDNRNIAEKMVTYFNEFVRNQYFLNTNHVNDEFITTLGRKSGIEKEQVESLYRAINHTQTATEIDDYQLMSLNQQIQNFYKNKT